MSGGGGSEGGGGGGGGEAVLSGENTSSSSYSGSEGGSDESSLPSTRAGPTRWSDHGATGKRMEQGKGVERSKNENANQQLKYYGRRNRGKQVASNESFENRRVRGEAEVVGLGPFLAVDLTSQIEAGIDQSSELTFYSRNGSSGGPSPGEVPARLQGTVQSGDVAMETAQGFNSEDDDEAAAAFDQRQPGEEANEAKILRVKTQAPEAIVSTRVEDREERRKNGILVDHEAISEAIKGKAAHFSRLSPGRDGLEGGRDDLAGTVVIFDEEYLPRSPADEIIGRKNSAVGSSGQLTGVDATLEGEEVEVDTIRGHSCVEADSSNTGIKGAQEAPIRRSTTSVLKIRGSSSNGDKDKHGKKGASRRFPRVRKLRVHLGLEHADPGEQETFQGSDDQEGSASKNMPLQLQLDLERRQHEESVLAKAEDVYAKQEILDSTKKIPIRGKEPGRKTHWDFVLEEMVWLSKDFEKERKWKLSQAKKVAARVSRSKLDVEAKGLRRQKEEEQRTRRVASNIAKDVKKFWMKVEKLVVYKHQLELEDRRKKALDKHLDFLLGQTERYSTMLAENLADNAVSPIPKALPLASYDCGDVPGTTQAISMKQEVLLDNSVLPRGRVDAAIYPPVVEGERSLISGNLEIREIDKSPQKGISDINLENSKEIRKLDIDFGDEDFDMDNELDEEDDETTIAADEALTTEDERREELTTLQRESELPLEELLKLYKKDGDELGRADDIEGGVDEGFGISDDDGKKLVSQKPVIVEEGRSPAQDELDTTTSALFGPWAKVEVVVENGMGSTNSRDLRVDDSEAFPHQPAVGGGPIKTSGGGKRPGLSLSQRSSSRSPVSAEAAVSQEGRSVGGKVATEVLLQHSPDLIDDGEYIPTTLADGIEEDDETTMEEEERLASADDDDPVAEVDLLKRESEMSLAELLAKYKSTATADGVYEEPYENKGAFMEDRQDRTSEAGTSGSSDIDEEEDELQGDIAGDMSEAKERMGEPSTSGREQWPLVPSGYGKKLKNAMDRKTHLGSNGNSSGREGKSSDKWNEKRLAPGVVAENGDLGHESETKGKLAASFLLEAHMAVDAETVEVLARVSEAAKRRGERVLKRSRNEEEKATSGSLLVDRDGLDKNSVAIALKEEMGAASARESGDVKDFVEVNLGDLNSLVQSPELDVDLGKQLQLGQPAVMAKSSAIKDVESGGDPNLEPVDGKTSQDKLADAAAEAQSAQPTGYTFLTTKVRTKLPFLLKHSLREYQHIGLDWLVTMYEKRLNGILADEMGLGKTIMTISLLAHLACDRGIWGPHLIVVPTSVMLNWETEFMKWCPAFKILTYFGSAKERKYKRQGWSKPNSFHVCITTYRLVIQDAKAFRRKKWKYLILDEAHLIKNWKSQRWQTLLNFNSKRRILLTGTPLQNDLMELWSLMHFLMPHVFQSHQEFRDWFSNPITGMVEGQEQINKEVVDRLHNVLRPFLLRRLKQDVEKQLPGKFEHVIRCRLSKRQRNLYEDFMGNSDTQATLSSGNFLALINVLMQLRKVCNHPDLFEGRPIMSSFDMSGLSLHLSSLVCSTLLLGPFSTVNLGELNLLFSPLELEMTSWECDEVAEMCTPKVLIEELSSTGEDSWGTLPQASSQGKGLIEELQAALRAKRSRERNEKIRALVWLNSLRCRRRPLYGSDLRKCVLVEDPVCDVHKIEMDTRRFLEFSSVIADMVKLPLTRLEMVMGVVESFVFAIPAARAPAPLAWCSHPASLNVLVPESPRKDVYEKVGASFEPLRPVFVRRQLFFPDRRLLQFDCGKLQELAVLLRRLKSEGHRALIFTQMTKMLDVLEGFISLYGYTYMRLDGSTKPEQRQILMQRFNTNPKIFLFILSTRSGGVGINLVGADTVIFYDSDWNPAMDQQAQDRCHRIGQTREVHIYRLVSESTIEENILKKANQKRVLDDLVIQSGSYNTEFFKKLDPIELFSGLEGVKPEGASSKVSGIMHSDGAVQAADRELSSAEVEAALKNAEDEADYMAMKRVEQEEAAENQEFTEEAFTANIDDEEFDEVEEGKSIALKNPAADGGASGTLKEGTEDISKATMIEEVSQIDSVLIPGDAEEEMDMLADVKQMAAAAAAAGRGRSSFEDQLWPVERYAMRFLELWDPRVDKASEAAQELFEEKEWELDQLEKLKEEQEAEIDEDNEPLYYESWDTAFANEAYRQQVEVLAQQQENQRQLEWETMEEEMRDADRAVVEASLTVVGEEHYRIKSKSLKKLKGTKFKSLKRGSLSSEELISLQSSRHRGGTYGDPQFELSSRPARSPSQRKRKAPKLLEEEMLVEDYAKRLKKDHAKHRILLGEKGAYARNSSEFDLAFEASDDDTWPDAPDSEAGDLQLTSPNSLSAKKNSGGKISIMPWPLKKGPLITLEKERKKDAAKMHELASNADPWTAAEDAILCAVVHEYGGNWNLSSDALAGMSDGSIYRGRQRHPIHCRERLRQLLAQYASATNGDPNNERNSLNAAMNTNLKVTEEHTKRLLDVVIQLPDNELLLQRHFGAVLTAVRNVLARKKAGIDNVLARNVAHPPHSGGFISLLKMVDPHLPVCVPTLEKAFDSRFSSDMQSLVSAALKDVESAEESRPSIIKDSINPAVGTEAMDGKELNDDKFNILEFLELGTMTSLNDGSDLASLKCTPVPVSVEDLLGFELPLAPVSAPSTALRTYAENIADLRFRSATSTGWGAGLYEWATAAASGLGSSGMPKGKSKKRPRPADSSKPPKPKHPRILKASKKKVLAETDVQATTQLSSKKKKKAQTAVSLSPTGDTSNTVGAAAPQGAANMKERSHMGPVESEALHHSASLDSASSQATDQLTVGQEMPATVDGALVQGLGSSTSHPNLNFVGDSNLDNNVSHSHAGKVHSQHISPSIPILMNPG